MSDMSRLRFTTFGAFRVTAPDGSNLTPRSRKACGLLALLLDAPDLARPRAILQDKLWSDRGQPQGAASLRSALTEIRKAFGGHRDVLRADRWMIALDSARVEADLRDPALRSRAVRDDELFLGDVDVRDPEFESWLRDRRLALEDEPEAAPRAARPERTAGEIPALAPPLLVLAVRGPDHDTRISRGLVQAVAKGVADRGSVALRWDEGDGDRGAKNGSVLSYRLEAGEYPMADGRAVSLQLTSLDDGFVRWQMTGPVPVGQQEQVEAEFARLISEGIDRTVHALSIPYGGARPGADPTLFFRLIETVFTKRGLDYDELCEGFRICFEHEGRGVYLAWQAMMSCYVHGERRPHDTAALRERTRDLLAEAVRLEPHNSLVLALASYTHGFVLNNVPVAHELAMRSLRLDRGSVMGWLSLGVANNYLSRFDEGYDCLMRARAIAGEGPYRHLVDLHAGISAALSGKFGQAVTILEAVHALTPDFAPPLRYLVATYLKLGDLDRAGDAVRRLRRLEPGFALPDLSDPDYPVPALQRAGMLDLEKLPPLP